MYGCDYQSFSCKKYLYRMILVLFVLLLFVSVLLMTFLCYFAFAAICLFIFYSFFMEWISLVSLESWMFFARFLATFSEFGLYLTLALMGIYFISDFFNLVIFLFKMIFKSYEMRMKSIENDENEDPQSRNRFHILMLIGYPVTIIFIVLFCILIDSYIIFSFAVILEIVLFIIVFAFQPITGLISLYRKGANSNDYSQSEDGQNRSILRKTINDLSYEDEDEDEEEENENKLKIILKNSIFFVASLNGMFIKHFKGHKNCCNTSRSFKVISSVLVILSQIFITVHQYYSSNMSLRHVIVMAIFKLCLIYKLCAYHFLDFVNVERVLYSLKHEKAKVTYVVVVLLTIGASTLPLAAISLNSYSNPVNSALFIETSETWLKYRDEKTILPQSFCSVQAQNGGLLHTDDLAMLTTLPRLYNVSDGKCYLIPSKRGLFNSTMKYIFGKNYEKDGIRIMCRIMPHYPILIITSDKILNDTLSYYPEDSNITFWKLNSKLITPIILRILPILIILIISQILLRKT